MLEKQNKKEASCHFCKTEHKLDECEEIRENSWRKKWTDWQEKVMLWLFRTNDKETQCKKLKTGTNLQDFRKFSSHCYMDILRR